MGAGKSTVGELLSSSIGYSFIDMDSLIEEAVNMKIPDIFSGHGEEHFRKLETETLQKLSESGGNSVISTGGGAVINPLNMEIIGSTGISIYLKAGIETIWQRIKEQDDRPLLNVEKPFETAVKLLDERKALYEKADITVETDGLTPLIIAEKIKDLIFNQGSHIDN